MQSKAEQIDAELTETNNAENTQMRTEEYRETFEQKTNRTAKEQHVNRDAISWTFRVIEITLFPFHCPLWSRKERDQRSGVGVQCAKH